MLVFNFYWSWGEYQIGSLEFFGKKEFVLLEIYSKGCIFCIERFEYEGFLGLDLSKIVN